MTKSKTHITLTVEEYGALTDHINHLEKTARQDMNILNMLLQMNSIYNENGQIRDKQVVFSSLKEQLQQLITIDVIAFVLAMNGTISKLKGVFTKYFQFNVLKFTFRHNFFSCDIFWKINYN